MDGKGKINGLRASGLDVSSRGAGLYGNGMKAISRSKRSRSSYLGRRYGKMLALIFVVVTSTVTVSALLVAPSEPGVPAEVKGIPPPPGFVIGGATYDEFGALLPNCDVTVTHVKTGNYSVVNSGPSSFYMFQPTWPDMLVGDEIRVMAVKGVMMGENTGYIPSAPNLRIDVTLNVLIPEFPIIIVPVVGIVALVAVTSVARRGKAQ